MSWYGARQRARGQRRIGLVAALLLVAHAAAADPVTIEGIVADVGLSADAAAQLRGGEIVETDPTPTSSQELAVGLAFLVPRPMASVLDEFRAAADMKADTQLVASTMIRGSLSDFSGVALPAGEAARYLAAAPGDTLNLSPEEIAAFKALASGGGDATSAVDGQLRQMLFDRYRAYRDRGLDGMAPYARGGDPERAAADELRAATQAAALLRRYAPALWQLLGAYPSNKPTGLEETFYVLRYGLDDRPNYVLRHRMVVPSAGGVALADRDFYVSHGYDTSQAYSGLIPVPEGTVIFYRDRVTTDQLAGFGASAKHAIGQRVMARQITAISERSRTLMEQKAP